MVTRRASAVWEGTLKDGKGTVSLGSGGFEGPYSYASRWESGPGTNPEELIGAAYAGCFSQALSLMLTKAGHPPKRITTEANVEFGDVEGEPTIKQIMLKATGVVPGIDEQAFREHAEKAKDGCPVSRALRGVEKKLEARLQSG